MRLTLTSCSLLLLPLSAPLLFSSCAVVDETEEAIDCVQVCDRYQECVDPDYDVTACADRCETRSEQSSDYEARVDACEECLDFRACSEQDPCDDECLPLTEP